MNKDKKIWKSGRGKLGVFQPFMGRWIAKGDSEMGPVTCTRSFSKVLEDKYIQMTVTWEFASKVYEEIAMIGIDEQKIKFWSFTSDGKKSHCEIKDGTDIHPEAICFEAQMPAGLARMIYWPDEKEGFHWAGESKNKKGWKRFTEHYYNQLI
jgi:hypothetical protein